MESTKEASTMAAVEGAVAEEGTPSRKSRRLRNSPSRFIARPSRQGLGVLEGDRAFLTFGRMEQPPARQSKRLRDREEEIMAPSSLGDGNTNGNDDELGKRSRRAVGTRRGEHATSMDTSISRGVVHNKRYAERKRPAAAVAAAGPSASKSKTHKKQPPLGSNAPRPPRVIIIGAGISGLSCARELSERRHDVLVVEARNRIGGRLRTIDLMLDKEWKEEGGDGEKMHQSDLYKVQKWSPVDVGGAFIHGTGVSTSEYASSSSHVGSHDFGTSSSVGRAGKKQSVDNKQQQQQNRDVKPIRKSERLHTDNNKRPPYKSNNDEKKDNSKSRNIRAEDGIGSLNPVYVLARQKLRLPLHAAEGAYTCLVDHNGNLISDEVDQTVAEEFNNVLDLATTCCDEKRYDWKGKDSTMTKTSNLSSSSTTGEERNENGQAQQLATVANNGLLISSRETGDMSRSPNYVSDDTATKSNNASAAIPSTQQIMLEDASSNENIAASIDPGTDFGTIFEECKRHHNEMSNTAGGKNDKNNNPNSTTTANAAAEEDVRKNLFQWHVAQLEMSSGAPMAQLGQKWNDDEPFGYGGDHSSLEGGFRDVIEALAEGFDCRGIGDRSIVSTGFGGNEGILLRRSGDFASTFSGRSSVPNYSDPLGGVTSTSRGVIQCGIEVTGVKIIEKEEVKLLRRLKKKKQPVVQLDESTLRRSSRENRGSKMPSFLDALSSRSSKRGQKPFAAGPPTEPLATDGASPSAPTSSYGNDCNTVVQVTTKCGLTLEADAVIVTTPLAILSIPSGSPGHIAFNPPLPTAKRNALNRLGVGAYNKCCMSFEKPFWNNLPRHLGSSASVPGNWNDEMTQRFDFIGHASAEHGKDILFFNMRNVPILVAIYGGSDYSKQVEGMHDEAVVNECMKVLKKICSKAIKKRDDSLKTRRQVDLTVPNWPIDFFVSRWGSDPYSRGAFSYVPKGVNGFQELRNMSTPINDFRPESAEETDESPKRPLIMFAGEATTPYHPSTIHGAFETGVREAYRLDLALEPDLNAGITFDESNLYQPTFSVRRAQAEQNPMPYKAPETKSKDTRRNIKTDPTTKSWWFDHDASIMRGVESMGSSAQTMSTIKTKVLAPASDTHSVEEMEYRYKSLMRMVAPTDGAKQMCEAENQWNLPGRRGSWLAAAQNLQGNHNIVSNKPDVAKAKLEKSESTVSDDSQTRRSSRKVQKKIDESFTFY